MPPPRVIYRTKRKELSHEKRVLRLDGEENLGIWRDFANSFIRSQQGVPAALAGYLLARGFAADRAALYGLPNDHVEDYLSDLQVALLPAANGKDYVVLENRTLFHQVFGSLLPFARRWSLCRAGAGSEQAGLAEVIAQAGTGWLHLMPVEAGTGGTEFLDVRRQLLHGQTGVRPWRGLDIFLGPDGRDILAVEDPQEAGPLHLDGCPASRLRILMLRPPNTNIPVPIGAIYSVATHASAPELSIRSGSLSVSVDLQTGRLGNSMLLSGGQPVYTDRHPDTGVLIVGMHVPAWHEIVGAIQNALLLTPMFSIVQFDLALTSGGFTVLEAKSRCDAAEFQVHGPLMGSAGAVEFLRNCGL